MSRKAKGFLLAVVVWVGNIAATWAIIRYPHVALAVSEVAVFALSFVIVRTIIDIVLNK